MKGTTMSNAKPSFPSSEVATVDQSSGEVVYIEGGEDHLDEIDQAIANLRNGKVISTITGTDRASRRRVFKAVTSSVPIQDNIGKTINLINVVVMPVFIADKDTKEKQKTARISLIDIDGTAYHASSPVILRDLATLFAIAGDPTTWGDEPEPVKVVEEGKKGEQYYTLVSAE